MPRCTRSSCGRWRPDLIVRRARQGVVFEDAWYCSPACLAAEASERLSGGSLRLGHESPAPRHRLGAILVARRAITAADLARALEAQRASGLRLGAQLERLGLASASAVLGGLAAQAGVGYLAELDPVRVRRGPGNLSRDAVRALGLVPFDLEAGGRLRVATAAPIPQVSVVALRELTGCAVEPLLVTDDHFRLLTGAYGLDRDETTARVTAVALRDVEDAAAWIARVAATDRAVRMTHVRSATDLWVHLEGAHLTEDLRLPLGEGSREEETCPAAPMSR